MKNGQAHKNDIDQRGDGERDKHVMRRKNTVLNVTEAGGSPPATNSHSHQASSFSLSETDSVSVWIEYTDQPQPHCVSKTGHGRKMNDQNYETKSVTKYLLVSSC